MMYHTTTCLTLIFNGERCMLEFHSFNNMELFVNMVTWAREQLSQGYNKVALVKLVMTAADELAVSQSSERRVLPLRFAKACVDEEIFQSCHP